MIKYIIIIVLVGTGYYFLDPSNRAAISSVTDVFNRMSTFVSTTKLPSINSNDENETTTVYKYQDQKGQWHYSNQPNDSKENVITDHYDNNANVISSVKPSPATETISKPENTSADTDDDISASPFTVYTEPGKIKKLFQNSKSIQQKLNQRKQTLDKQIDAL